MVGSNIANLLLVIRIAALIMPIQIGEATLRRDSAMVVSGTLFFIALSLHGELDTKAGILLLTSFFVFLGMSYWRDTHAGPDANAQTGDVIEELEGWPKSTLGSLFTVIFGILGLCSSVPSY